jgi:hypothetical protein
MSEKCIFEIRSISIELGYELSCAGLMDEPLRLERLFEAVVLAATLGQNVHYEIRIFDVDGQQAEVIEVAPQPKTEKHLAPENHRGFKAANGKMPSLRRGRIFGGIIERSSRGERSPAGEPVPLLQPLRKIFSALIPNRQAVLAD